MEAPENIGSALKSIISRYGELKTSPATLIDAEGEELNFNKVDTALKSVGVSMHDANGQFRAFDDVIMDLAKTWQTLDRNSQRYIATVMAGNRQQSRFIALVSDYERLSELTEEAANAQDAGTLQYLKTLDSIETKVNQLQVAFQEFYTSMGLEDLFKGALDTLTGFITQLNSLPKIFETIPVTAIGMGINLVTAVKNILTLLSVPISQSINRLKTSLEGLAGISYKIKLKVDHQAAISDTEAAVDEMVKTAQAHADKNPIKLTPETSGLKKFLSNDIVKNINSILGSVIQVAGATLSMTALAKGDSFKSMSDTRTEGSKISSGLFGTGGNVLGSALTGLATGGWVGGLVGIGVGLAKSIPNIITLIDGLNASIDEQITQLDKEIEKQKEQVIIRKNEVSTLENAAKKLEDLEKHQYDSTEAQQEYIDYMNSLADEHHGLVESIDQEGNSVISLNSLYKELITTRSLLAKETLLQEQQELSKRQKLVEAATSTETQLMAKAWDFTSFDVNTSFMQNSVQKLFSSWFSQSEMEQLNSLYDEMTGQGYVDSLHEFLLYLRDSSNNVAQELYKKSGIQLDDENGFIYTKANLSELKSQLINSTSDSALSTIRWFFEDLGDNLFNEIFGQSFKTFNEKANTDDWVYAINKYEVWRETRAAELERIAEISEQLSSVNQKRADWANTMKSATDNIQQLYAFTNDNLSQAIATRISANYNPDSDSLKWNELFNNLFNQFNTDVWSTLSETYGDLMSYTFTEVITNIRPILKDNQYVSEFGNVFYNHYREQRDKLRETFENGFSTLSFSVDGALLAIEQNFAPKYWSSILSQFQGANQYFTNNLKTQGQQIASAYYQMLENIAAINDRDMRNQALSILTAGDLTSYEGIEALKTSFENYANTNAGFDVTSYLNDLNVIESSLTFNVNTLVNTFVDGLKDIDESVEKFAKNASKGLSYEDAAAELTKLQITDPDLLFSDVYEFDENVGAFVYTLDGYQKAQANTLKKYNEEYGRANAALQRQSQALSQLGQLGKVVGGSIFTVADLSIDAQMLFEQQQASGQAFYQWQQEQRAELSRGQAELDAAREAMQASISYQLIGIFKEINFEELLAGRNISTNTRKLQQFISATTSEVNVEEITQAYIQMFSRGGQVALEAYKQLIAKTSVAFDYDTARTLYLGAAGEAATAISELLNAQVGEVISQETAELVTFATGINYTNENNLLITSAEGFLEQAKAIYLQVAAQFEAGKGSLADVNSAYAAYIKGQADHYDSIFKMVGDSAELGIEDLEAYANMVGMQLSELMSNSNFVETTGFGKYRLTSKAVENLTGSNNISQFNTELIDALKQRNEAIIESDRKIVDNIFDEIDKISQANVGDKVDVNYLLRLTDSDKALYEFLGVIHDGIATITENTNLPGLIQSIINQGVDGEQVLESDIARLQDTLDELLKSYAELLSGGIAGTLSHTDALNLKAYANSQLGIQLSDADFHQTQDGLQLSRQKAIQLYDALKKVDQVAAQIALNDFAEQLTASNSKYENMSAIVAHIKELNDAIDSGEAKNVEALKQEVALYEDLERAQHNRADSYAFMDKSLPEGMQGPENYWNAVGEAYKVMNESAQSGYMSLQDFYNIVNEMNNLAALGDDIEFLGMTLNGSLESAAELLEKGYGALENVDGEGVKIKLSEFGVDLASGADSMAAGFDKGIQQMAQSQIDMLDAEIALLEAIVAMEDLGEIDTKGNGLDVEDIFDGNDFSEPFEQWRKKSLEEINKDKELAELLKRVNIGKATLYDLFTAEASELTNLLGPQEEVAAVMNALYQMAVSGDFNVDDLESSMAEWLGGINKVLSITDKNGTRHILNSKGTWTTFDINSKEMKTRIDNINKELKTTYTKENIEKLVEQYLNGETITGLNNQFAVHYSLGNITPVLDKTSSVITGWQVDGQTYTDYQEALSAFALQEAGADAGSINITTKTGTIQLNNGTQIEIKLNNDNTPSYTWSGYSPAHKTNVTYHANSLDDLYTQIANAFQIYDSNGYVDLATTKMRFAGTVEADVNYDLFYAKGADEIKQEMLEELKLTNPDGQKIFNLGMKIGVPVKLEADGSLSGYTTKTLTDLLEGKTDEGKISVTMTAAEGSDPGISALLEAGEDGLSKILNITLQGLDGHQEELLTQLHDLESDITIHTPEGTEISVKLTGFEFRDGQWQCEGITADNQSIQFTSTDIEGFTLDQDGSTWSWDVRNPDNIKLTVEGLDEANTAAGEFKTAWESIIDYLKKVNELIDDVNGKGLPTIPTENGTTTSDNTTSNSSILNWDARSASEKSFLAGVLAYNQQAEKKDTFIPLTDAEKNWMQVFENQVKQGIFRTKEDYNKYQELQKKTPLFEDTYLGPGPASSDSLTSLAPDTVEIVTTDEVAIQDAKTVEEPEPSVVKPTATTAQNTQSENTDRTGRTYTNLSGSMQESDVQTLAAEAVDQTEETTESTIQIIKDKFGNLESYIEDVWTRLENEEGLAPDDLTMLQELGQPSQEFIDAFGEVPSQISSAAESIATYVANNEQLILKTIDVNGNLADLGVTLDKIPDQSGRINALNSYLRSTSGAVSYATGTLAKFITQLQQIQNKPIEVKVAVAESRTGTTTFSANAKGNALARGRGTLMGELGPELWVSGGHYYVAGQNGAEFVDLPDDAIVFNHLQTKKLLGSGKGGRGTAVTNEKNAVARASGTTGPAMASAREALAQLKQIRAMWQAMLGATAQELGSMAGRGGGGSSGGGDGEKFSPELGDYERWYNWLRQIEKLEQQITLEEAKRENMRNGHAYGKSLQDEIDKLHKEIEVSQDLSDKQKEFYELRRQEQAKSMFGQIFTYDEDGLMQYRKNVVDDLLAKLNETDEHGNLTGAAESAVKQVSFLKDWMGKRGYNIDSLIKDPETGKSLSMTKEEDAAKIMERFWDEFDGWIDELDGLYDSYNDKLKDIEDLIAKENELLQEYVDNQLELEDRIMKAIEAREQALIDTMNKEKDALAEASSAYITGLTDALNKERQMYDRNKDDQETTRLQRQLGILQRSGGSAAEIRSLQEQINDRLQDSYFDAQQAQIDAVKEASDLELERLEQQIEIAQETLDFYKEHGLFNEEMEAIMRESDEEIISFITTYDQEWKGLSALAHDEQLRELTQMVQLWTEDRGKEMGWKEWRDKALQEDETLTAGDLDKFHEVYSKTFADSYQDGKGDSYEVARAKAAAAATEALQTHKAKGTEETQQEETTTTTQTETETKQFEPFTGSISSGGRYLYEQPSESSKIVGHFGPEAGTGKSFTVLDYDPAHPGWGYVKVGKQEGWARLTGGSIDLETQRKVGVSGGSSVSTGGQGGSQVKTTSEGSEDTTIGKVQDPITGDWVTAEELNRRLAIRQGISVNSGLTPLYNTNSVLGNLPASTIDNTNNSRIINFYDSHFELASETTQDVIMELNQKMNPYVK